MKSPGLEAFWLHAFRPTQALEELLGEEIVAVLCHPRRVQCVGENESGVGKQRSQLWSNLELTFHVPHMSVLKPILYILATEYSGVQNGQIMLLLLFRKIWRFPDEPPHTGSSGI